jgi:transposase
MARKNYTEEFRRQAVDLYRSTPGATLRGIAADLGISRHTLQVWVHALDPDPSSPLSEPSSEPAARQGKRGGRASSADAELTELRARLAALETENAELLVEQTKLATERDILRQAAKYFAGETHW